MKDTPVSCVSVVHDGRSGFPAGDGQWLVVRRDSRVKEIGRAKGSQSAGVTVVELLIVALLLSVIFLVVGAMFVSSSRAYQVNETVSLRQQNTMTARALLQSELSLAGYRGVCAAAASDPFGDEFTFVVKKGESDTITVRYIDDRWGQGAVSTGTCGGLRTVTFAVGDGEAEGGLWVQYGESVEPGLAVENVIGMSLSGYVTTDGGIAATKPAAFIGVEIQLRFADAPTVAFTVGIRNAQVNAFEESVQEPSD